MRLSGFAIVSPQGVYRYVGLSPAKGLMRKGQGRHRHSSIAYFCRTISLLSGSTVIVDSTSAVMMAEAPTLVVSMGEFGLTAGLCSQPL